MSDKPQSVVQSPRDLFNKNQDRVRRHADMVRDDSVVEAIHTAFAQMNWRLNTPGESQMMALNNNAMREGARAFIQEFLTLAEPIVQKSRNRPELEPET
jgi:hypothetical protein